MPRRVHFDQLTKRQRQRRGRKKEARYAADNSHSDARGRRSGTDGSVRSKSGR